MRALRKDRILFLALLALYGTAICAYKAARWHDIQAFPFFAWDLYVWVPNESVNQRILVTELNGKKLDPPQDVIDLRNLRGHYAPTKIFRLPWDMANSIRNQMPGLTSTLANEVFNRYFPGAEEMTFRLEEIRYEPLEKWKNPGSGTVVNLGEFHMSRHNEARP